MVSAVKAIESLFLSVWQITLAVLSAFLTPHVVSKTALTQGQWCVHDKIWFDEKNRFVYFHGYREDPLENHLYVVSLDQPLNVVRLTELGCSHSVQINQVLNIVMESYNFNNVGFAGMQLDGDGI